MKLVLEVKKERYAFFIELVKSLGFVRLISQEETLKKDNGLKDMAKALNDVKLHQQGLKKLKTIEELLDEI
jgi:hypothetical protein